MDSNWTKSLVKNARNLDMNELICGNNIDILKGFENNCIDLTVTSPPYDELRLLQMDIHFDFEGVVKESIQNQLEEWWCCSNGKS